MTELLDAFTITYQTGLLGGAVDLGATLSARSSFLDYFGETFSYGVMGFVDDPIAQPYYDAIYVCISVSGCSPESFTANTRYTWPSEPRVGTFLVRDAAAMPEPSTLALLGLGLGHAGRVGRRRVPRA